MQKITIKIRKGKHHTAKSIVTGLSHAQQEMANALVRVMKTTHDTLLLLHAVEMRDMLRELCQRQQQQYTLKLTVIQAEAYRQLWGRMDLKYEAYGAVQVQDLLNEINRVLDLPMPFKQLKAKEQNIEDFNPNHMGTL